MNRRDFNKLMLATPILPTLIQGQETKANTAEITTEFNLKKETNDWIAESNYYVIDYGFSNGEKGSVTYDSSQMPVWEFYKFANGLALVAGERPVWEKVKICGKRWTEKVTIGSPSPSTIPEATLVLRDKWKNDIIFWGEKVVININLTSFNQKMNHKEADELIGLPNDYYSYSVKFNSPHFIAPC